MTRNLGFPIVVGGILIVLAVLYFNFGHLKHEREEEVARYASGTDELSQVIRTESETYRIANRNQQRGILAVACVVVLIAIVWWVGQRRGG